MLLRKMNCIAPVLIHLLSVCVTLVTALELVIKAAIFHFALKTLAPKLSYSSTVTSKVFTLVAAL